MYQLRRGFFKYVQLRLYRSLMHCFMITEVSGCGGCEQHPEMCLWCNLRMTPSQVSFWFIGWAGILFRTEWELEARNWLCLSGVHGTRRTRDPLQLLKNAPSFIHLAQRIRSGPDKEQELTAWNNHFCQLYRTSHLLGWWLCLIFFFYRCG